MRIELPGCLLLLALASAAAPQSTDTAGHRVDALIGRAIDAHGGSALRELRSVVLEWNTDDALVFESRRPDPPWDTVRRWEAFAIDFAAARYADARIDRAGGYEWVTGTVLDRARSHRLDYRGATYRDTSQGFAQAIVDAAAWSPVVLLRWLSDHSETARYAGRRTDAERAQEVLEVTFGSETMEVFIDTDSGRVSGAERSYLDYDGTPVPLTLRYLDDAVIDGLHHSRRVELRMHGYLARQASLAHAEYDEVVDSYLSIPSGFELSESEPSGVRDFRIEEIADGVYFVGQGVMFQLIVEFDDFLVALDGSSGDVAKRIEAVQARLPGKPFRYVLASHHHNDHLHGLDEFAELGAKILVAPGHTAAVRRYLADQGVKAPAFIEVAEKRVIRSGGRELQVFDIGPLPHTEHLLAAYLPAEKILFEADLFVLGGQRKPVKPASANGAALLSAIDDNKLDVEQIVDPHSPLIAGIGDLREAVALVRGRQRDVGASVKAHLQNWHTAAAALRR